MKTLIIIALLPSLALGQPLPQPKPPSGSCPHGYTSSGSCLACRVRARRTPATTTVAHAGITKVEWYEAFALISEIALRKRRALC